MDLDHLHTFCLVAQERSFTRAAELLNVTQPTVTGRIQTLEAGLGIKLFARRGRGVELTAAGRALLPYAQRIRLVYEEGERAIRAAAPDASSQLKVAATPSTGRYLLAPILASFPLTHPGIQIRFFTGHPNQVVQMVIDRVADLGLVTATVPHRSLHYTAVSAEPVALIGSPDHPLFRRPRITAADLQGWPFIRGNQENAATWRRAVEEELQGAGVLFRDTIEVDNVEIAKALLRGSDLLTFLPLSIVGREVESGELAARAVEDLPEIRRNVFLVHRKGEPQVPPPARDLIAAIAAREEPAEHCRSQWNHYDSRHFSEGSLC